MSQAQKKNQKVPTFSELAGNVNRLKREVANLEAAFRRGEGSNYAFINWP